MYFSSEINFFHEMSKIRHYFVDSYNSNIWNNYNSIIFKYKCIL